MDQQEAARVMVAHLFQRAGRAELSESELTNAASLDMDWFPPKEARKVVAGLVRAGYLERSEEGELRPVFDVRGVKVPLGFRPPGSIGSSLPPPGAIADRVPAQQSMGSSAVAGRASQTQRVRSMAEGTQSDAGMEMEREGKGEGEGEGEGEGDDGGDLDGDPLAVGGLLQRFANEGDEEVGVWVERMEQVVQQTGDSLVPEVALLVAAARRGLDVSDLAAQWRKRLETTRPSF